MTINKMNISKNLKQYMQLIIDNGYECFLVGGAVRDYLLNVENKDYDFCTNIPLDRLKSLIPQVTIMKENKHRNTGIIRTNGYDIEFSTYRGSNLKEDLSNRDFTMNAIAVDVDGNYIDYYDGINSINKKIISLVKENGEGLKSDPLRILRAIRQALKCKFEIDDNTKKQMISKKNLLGTVAPERIYNEFKQIIMFENVGYYLNNYKEIFFELIPELKRCDGFDQHNEYHVYDIYSHTIKVIENSPSKIYVKIASLFHDIGKPSKYYLDDKGIGHFLNHAQISNDIFRKFAKKYKLDNKSKKIISDLVLYHEDSLSEKSNKIYNFYKKFNMNRIELLFDLKRADILSQNPKFNYRIDKLNKLEKKYIDIRDKYNSIAYSGADLIKLGYTGKIIKEIIDDIKRQIINNRLSQGKSIINEYVKKNYPI